MKHFIIIVLLASSFTLQVQSRDSCLNDILSKFKTLSVLDVDSRNKIGEKLQAHINAQLTKSLEYRLLAIHAKTYKKNRFGFQKLYQTLSDRSYDNAIELIRQITTRGGKVDFNSKHEILDAVQPGIINLGMDELQSLSLALDNEKKLTEGAMHVQVEQNFLDDQSEMVRVLTGYVQDLSKLMSAGDASVALHWFDKYLQDQYTLELIV